MLRKIDKLELLKHIVFIVCVGIVSAFTSIVLTQTTVQGGDFFLLSLQCFLLSDSRHDSMKCRYSIPRLRSNFNALKR